MGKKGEGKTDGIGGEGPLEVSGLVMVVIGGGNQDIFEGKELIKVWLSEMGKRNPDRKKENGAGGITLTAIGYQPCYIEPCF